MTRRPLMLRWDRLPSPHYRIHYEEAPPPSLLSPILVASTVPNRIGTVPILFGTVDATKMGESREGGGASS